MTYGIIKDRQNAGNPRIPKIVDWLLIAQPL